MTLDDLIPPYVIAAVRDLGLHKVAGAMLGVPELTLNDAVTSLGTRAYLRRKEARSIVDGIVAYGTLTNEKLAENPALMALLRRAAMPALAGAGIAAVPQLISNQDPMQPHKSVLPSMGIGALLGGLGGTIRDVGQLSAPLSQEVSQALRAMP